MDSDFKVNSSHFFIMTNGSKVIMSISPENNDHPLPWENLGAALKELITPNVIEVFKRHGIKIIFPE